MNRLIYVGFEVFNKEILHNFKYLKFPIKEKYHGELGHEIHIPRLLLIDMIDKLTTEDIVVTSQDRKFLYQIFCNTLSYEELLEKEEKYINYDKIYLCMEGTSENLVAKGYREKLYPQSDLIKKYAPMFLKSNIEHYNVEKEFVILHYRISLVDHINRNNTLNDMDMLLELFKDFNIFIFGQENDIKMYSKYNLITKLQDYVTLMNHGKCLYVVSVVSGGGQLTQYFCNSNVLYYNKNDCCFTDSKIDFWDQTTVSNVNRYYFDDLEELQYYVKISGGKVDKLHNSYYYVENVRLMYKLNMFDWNWYINYYDLINNNVNTQKLAENHYLRYGREENKVMNSILVNFDWQYYIINNQDLIQNGICNRELAEMHYIKHGYKENRKCNNLEYDFSNIWFNNVKHNFDRYVTNFKDKDVTFLEIGCYEGAATTYCLCNILTHENSKIHVIDTFNGSMEHSKEEYYNLFNRFNNNINLSNSSHKVIVHKGYSHDILKILNTNFDFIYIDASHTSYDVLADAILAFPLLKINGILIFDDYEWIKYNDETLNPKLGINSFLLCYKNFIEVLEINYQVIIKKIS